MFIPLNLKERQDLGLSVIRSKEGYSVAIMSVINGYGMDSVPSYMNHYRNDDENIDTCICTTDYETIKGPDLYDCINKCIEQLGV